MKKKSFLKIFLGIFAFVILLSGCTKSPALEKEYFAIAVKRPGSETPPEKGAILKLRKIRVSPQYRGVGLVYRLSDVKFETDFYNEFFISPGDLLTKNTMAWLQKSGLFQHVVSPESSVVPTHYLEGVVSPLYGDYRDPKAPKAVMGIEFFLIREAGAIHEIVFQKRYVKEVPFKGGSPADLVKGWNEALKQILTEFEKDLRGVDLKATS